MSDQSIPPLNLGDTQAISLRSLFVDESATLGLKVYVTDLSANSKTQIPRWTKAHDKAACTFATIIKIRDVTEFRVVSKSAEGDDVFSTFRHYIVQLFEYPGLEFNTRTLMFAPKIDWRWKPEMETYEFFGFCPSCDGLHWHKLRCPRAAGNK